MAYKRVRKTSFRVKQLESDLDCSPKDSNVETALNRTVLRPDPIDAWQDSRRAPNLIRSAAARPWTRVNNCTQSKDVGISNSPSMSVLSLNDESNLVTSHRHASMVDLAPNRSWIDRQTHLELQ